jgi:hypothetical protein
VLITSAQPSPVKRDSAALVAAWIAAATPAAIASPANPICVVIMSDSTSCSRLEVNGRRIAVAECVYQSVAMTTLDGTERERRRTLVRAHIAAESGKLTSERVVMNLGALRAGS